MFSKDYKEQMKNNTPDKGRVEDIKRKMYNCQSQPEKAKRSTFRANRLVACACYVIAAVLVLATVAVAFGNPKIADPAYADIYKAIDDYQRENNEGIYRKSTFFDDGIRYFGVEAVPESVASGVKGEMSSTDNGLEDYSETNLQVEGVQEADIIKTDGKYIYALSSQYLYIVEVAQGELKLTGKIERNVYALDDSYYGGIDSIYVAGDRLVVVKRVSVRESTQEETKGDSWFYRYHNYREFTNAEIYDISDKSNIKSQGEVGQDGYLNSTRMIGDTLYMVSSYYVYDELDKSDPSTYIPSTNCDGETNTLSPDDISICPIMSSTSYLVVSAIDVKEGRLLSNKAMLGCGDTIYMNTKNLFVASYDYVEVTDVEGYNGGYSQTILTKFALNNGQIEYQATGTVNGTILNQFSMDEYNDYFRIVTTSNNYLYKLNNDENGGIVWSDDFRSEQSNNLYVLNRDLEVVGKIEGLAEDERVYSVRFMGDAGYFVTFRQTDPLYSVDLSNPSNPTILGALKIPGFSEYLHPYGDNLLFGIGRNADEEGRTDYMKLSMFDTTDKTNVTEKHTLVIDGYRYSDVGYNHKAILINVARNIIAFPADDSYLVYTYDANEGFKRLAEIKPNEDYGSWYWSNMRGVYVGNYMYVYSDVVMLSYDMSDYSLVQSINLDEIKAYDEVELYPAEVK